jgi:hypothetical protein
MRLRKSHLPALALVALFVACSSDQTGAGGAGGVSNAGGSGGASKGGQGGGSSGNANGGHAGTATGGGGAFGNGGSGQGGSSGFGGNVNGGAGNGGGNSGGASGSAGNGNGGGGGGNAGHGGTGGSSGGGGMSGGGNAGATSCSFPSGWNPGSATYTTYSLPNPQTACGYEGSNNNIKNIAVAGNYAAIPGNSSSDFNTKDRCGACVQIGNAIVTIVDECPFSGNTPCQNNPGGHLDLSTNAASAGNVQGDPNLHNQNQWKFVPCPINGNVVVRLKQGNNNEFYVENEILPIASVNCGGQTGSRQSYGAWHFQNNVNGQSCSVTDIANRTINITVGNSQGQNVDTGVQFPKCK